MTWDNEPKIVAGWGIEKAFVRPSLVIGIYKQTDRQTVYSTWTTHVAMDMEPGASHTLDKQSLKIQMLSSKFKHVYFCTQVSPKDPFGIKM